MGRRGRNAGLWVVLLVVVSVGGCIDETLPPPPAEAAATRFACPAPCATIIDRGTRWEPAVAIDPRDGARIVAASMDQGFDGTGQRYSWPLAHASHDAGPAGR